MVENISGFVFQFLSWLFSDVSNVNRGYKFAQLENLGATLDQYDAINMNDNDLKKIENFPYFQRLKVLYLANNRIRKIATDFVTNVPNLEVNN